MKTALKKKKIPVNTNLIGIVSKYNTYGLKDGEIVRIKDKYSKYNRVMIKEGTIVGLYAQVHGLNDSPNDSWTVLTSKLTPLTR